MKKERGGVYLDETGLTLFQINETHEISIVVNKFYFIT
jgi:hypothetical protein